METKERGRSDWGRAAAQHVAEDKLFCLRFYPLFARQIVRRTMAVQARRQAVKLTVRGTEGQ